MTMQSPGKAKIAGIALLGVAAVALVFGVVSAAGGGSDTTTAAQASQTRQHQGQAPNGGKPGQAPNGDKPKPGNGAPPANQPPQQQPGAGGQGQPGGQGQQGEKTTKVIQPPNPEQVQQEQQAGQGGNQVQMAGVDKSAPVRVYNNSTIKHLADKAANALRGDGFNVVQVGNYPNGVIPATTVYYRPGSNEQGTAEAAAKKIGAKAEPRFPGLQQASPGVVVIVTQDYQN